MWNPPDVWIRLKALSTPSTIDQRKQRALQAAYTTFAQLGLRVRNGEMTSWCENLSQPEDWPLVLVEESSLLHWQPVGVVISETALRAASVLPTEEWEPRIGVAVVLLLDAGLSVVAMAPGANRVIHSMKEFQEWSEFVVNPASRRAEMRCSLEH